VRIFTATEFPRNIIQFTYSFILSVRDFFLNGNGTPHATFNKLQLSKGTSDKAIQHPVNSKELFQVYRQILGVQRDNWNLFINMSSA
jgi:hypothetical protein